MLVRVIVELEVSDDVPNHLKLALPAVIRSALHDQLTQNEREMKHEGVQIKYPIKIHAVIAG